jgi:hypothetical protein
MTGIMSLLSRIFAFTRTPPAASRPHSQLASGHSQQAANPVASQNSTRRELLRVVLRDTLNRHGIPAAWVAAEVLVSTSRAGQRGVHWRLVIKHWEPRLLTHGIAFQQSLIKRVMTFDPLAANWLMGISWQFDLPDESLCPPMPHPGLWTSQPPVRTPAPAPAVVAGGSGDVIAGPVMIAAQAKPAGTGDFDEAKADLEQLFAVRDADFKRHFDGSDPAHPGDEATRPMFLGTEPARL